MAVLACACLASFSCAKREKIGAVEKPVKVKESPVAGTYVSLVKSELERYQEEPVDSIDSINKLIEENPEVAFFYYQRAVINADSGKWEEVVSDCRESLRLNPKNGDAMLLLGKGLGVLNKHEEAIKYLEAVRKIDPARQDVYPILAKEYMNAQQYNKAENVMLDLLRRDSEAMVAYYYLGAIYGAYMNKPRKAIEIYERILDREPENIEVIEAVSQLYLELDDTEKALERLLELERYRPSDVSLKLKIAQIYYKMKDFEPAIERFEKILERNPESDKIMYYLAVLYEGIEKFDKAMNMYASVPEDSSLYKDARLRLAYLYKAKDDDAMAKSVLNEAMRKQPKVIEFYQYLGGMYEREGDYDNAIKVLQKAAYNFKDDERIYFAIGTLYDRKGDSDNALNMMYKVLKINPKNANALNYIGYSLVEKGVKMDEAEDMLQEAVRLKPDDGYVIDSLAWLYYKKGNYTKSLYLLKQAVGLEPDEPTILKHLGQIYLQMGDKQTAQKYLKKALTIWQKREIVDKDEVDELVSLIQEAIK